jgi:5-methylcytosine-specific restriction endonuclease McrBC GTP-binding regulatory subunit McrB
LDRAFTIELTEVDFIGYPPEKSEASESGDDDRQALLRTFTQNGRYPRIDKGDIRKVVDRPERFGVDLQSLNLSLRRSRMHFGYRVFDEIMQFVFNAEENGLFTSDEAFDHAVLMKVLPKFNGSRAKLQTALFELLHWCHKAGTMSSDDRADLEARFDTVVPKDSETVEDQWRYPATGRRAALMMQDLYTDGFAAFG